MNQTIVGQAGLPLQITQVSFSVLGAEEAHRLASIPVTRKEGFVVTAAGARSQFPFGVLDPRMGISDRSSMCKTCGKGAVQCMGHYGVIHLEMPVFHPGYFPAMVRILRSICKSCSRILLSQSEVSDYVRRFRNPKGLEFLQRKNLLVKLQTAAAKVTRCPHCGAPNGVIRKLKEGLKLIHEPFTSSTTRKTNTDDREEWESNLSTAVEHNDSLTHHIRKAQQDLTPDVVWNLLSRVTPDDAAAMDTDETGKLKDLVLTELHVPPPAIRPSPPPTLTGQQREDDLTTRLQDILSTCEEMKKHKESGGQTAKFMELWDLLQLSVAGYIDGSLPGFSQAIKSKTGMTKSYVQRLKGKTGRFRMNLSGKRVNFSGRSVISPDPNLDITELAIPLRIAKILTYPQRVFSQNIEQLKAMVMNGPHKYPGANYVRLKAENYQQRSLRFDNVPIAQKLQEGDIVERHVINGDAMLFNRQPSLHRVSMMCHRARVLPHRTLRFNECVCSPYNADFDGDEMNIHIPQTEEARAEALELMITAKNIINAKNGEPIIAAMQDFLTGGYLLTRKDMFLDRAQMAQCVSHILEHDVQEIPHPALLKPMELWTGKQVLQVLVRANKKVPVDLNFQAKAKYYTGSAKNPVRSFCKEDGYITFFNSEHISGCLEKKVMGGGAKDAFFFSLKQAGGIDTTARCMSRVSRLTSRWLMNYGFSIGIDDVTPDEDLKAKKEKIIELGYEKAAEHIQKFKSGNLEAAAGCTREETVEMILNGTLSDIREECGNLCVKSLHYTNAPLIMALCGSKGSNINIAQMVVCVGQQTVSGKRIGDHFIKRSTPHFSRGTRDAVARGFVRNSFYSGLQPTEFFFHTMGGREGLVDSAVKTAETGYLARRIMKYLEDLVVQYDYTVTNAVGGIVQFRYGEDSLDPIEMENGSRPLNFEATWNQIVNTESAEYFSDVGLSPFNARSLVQREMDSEKFSRCSKLFMDEMKAFMQGKINEVIAVRKSVGLEPDPPEKAVDKLSDPGIALKVQWLNQQIKLTQRRLLLFFKQCSQKHTMKLCQPGTPCGVIAAQSLSEPATQMTLKTFHFAGVASMNITQGVPRIQEIMNAHKNISTPVVTTALLNNKEVEVARIVKGRIERTYLGDIMKKISEVYAPTHCFLRVQICLKTIKDLQLNVSIISIRDAILNAPKNSKLGLQAKHLQVVNRDTIDVAPTNTSREDLLHNLQFLKINLPKVIICGLRNASRAIIHNSSSNPKEPKYGILVESDDLRSVLVVPGVDPCRTSCNHIISTEQTLGIEAARGMIISEITKVLKNYGLSVDIRHTMLLADTMTMRGKVLGATLAGLVKGRDSVLMLASFERTSEHLFAAATHNRADKYMGVSESIILGMPPKAGTGLFKVLRDHGTATQAMSKATGSLNPPGSAYKLNTLMSQWNSQFLLGIS